jgi:hypothetical protein
MIPLMLLSMMVLTIGIERFLALRREKVFPAELIDQLSSLSQSQVVSIRAAPTRFANSFLLRPLTFCDPCWSKSDAHNWKWKALLPAPANAKPLDRRGLKSLSVSSLGERQSKLCSAGKLCESYLS